MKEQKRVQKALLTLDTIVNYLEYYMGDTPEFRELAKVDIQNMEELIKELSLDQKVQNIKLAKKIKAELEIK